MSDRAKEGCWIGLLTIVHVVITSFLLGKMPMVLFYHFQYTDAISFVLWMLYVLLLYVITLIYEKKIKPSSKELFKAVAFGFLLALGKGVMDTVIDRVGSFYTNASRRIVLETQFEVLIFGIILFAALQRWAANRKLVFDFSKIKLPAAVIAAVMVVYVFCIL